MTVDTKKTVEQQMQPMENNKGQDNYGWSYWIMSSFIDNSGTVSPLPSNTSVASSIGLASTNIILVMM